MSGLCRWRWHDDMRTVSPILIINGHHCIISFPQLTGTSVLYHDRLAFWGVSFNLVKIQVRSQQTVVGIERKTQSALFLDWNEKILVQQVRCAFNVWECSTLWLDGFQIAEISDLYPRVLSQFNKILLRVLFTAVPCVLCYNCQVVGTGPNKTSHRWRTKMGLTAILF